MIKGCTKRVIVVKNIESDIFEEAYFIVRPSPVKAKSTLCENDFLSEADRIVSSKSANSPFVCAPVRAKRKTNMRDALFCMCGCAFSGALVLTLRLLMTNFV